MEEKSDRISLTKLLRVFFKRKKLIAIVTAAFILVVLVQYFVIAKPKYQSEVTLEINNIETTPLNITSDDGNEYSILKTITQNRYMNFDTYVDEVKADRVLEGLIGKLEDEDQLEVDDLDKKLAVSPDEENKTITLRYSANNPKEGDKILSKITDEFKSHITKLSQENSQMVLENMEEQIEIERERFEDILEEYEQEIGNGQRAYELELEIEDTYEQITDYKGKLNDLEIEKEALDSALEEVKSSGSSNSGLIMRPSDEGSYMYVDGTGKSLEMNLVETNAKIESTNKTIKKLQDNILDLQVDYYETELLESSIEQKLDLAKDSFHTFSKKYEELSMEDSVDTGELTIKELPDAGSSSKRVGMSLKLKLIVAAGLGIIMGVLLSLFLEYSDVLGIKKAKDQKN